MKIKDICEYGIKSKIKAGEGLAEGRYKFFTSSSLLNKYLDSYQFDKPGIIMGTGGNATLHYCDEPFSVSTDCLVLFPIKEIGPKYLYYYLKRNIHILQAGFKGAGLKHTSKKYINEIRIKNNLSFEDQLFVVRTLDKINDIIDKKNQQIEEYDQLIKSQFIEMFGEYDLSKPTDKWKAIKNIADVYTGTTPSTLDETNWDGDVLWITPAEMNEDSFYIYDTKRKITEKGQGSLKLMPKNTVLLSTRAPIGKLGIVGNPMCCNQGFKNFKFFDNIGNPVYYYILLKMNVPYLQSIGAGTTFKEISKSNAEKILVPVPSIDKQNQFADFVKQIDKSKFIVQKQISYLQELLDSKMDEFFW